MKDSFLYSILKNNLPYKLRFYIRQTIEYPETMGIALRHENAFATHVPVLMAIAQIMPIQNVLEFGSGIISTPLFLNPAVFPSVESVVSYENDYDWYQLVQSQVTDARLNLNFNPNEMHTIIKSLDLSGFDLIFVDDSKSVEQRSKTISQLAVHRSNISGIIAIHDFEQRAYRNAASTFMYQKRFRAFNPEVGLLWSRKNLETRVFRRADQIIKANAQHIPPDDVNGWIKALETRSS